MLKRILSISGMLAAVQNNAPQIYIGGLTKGFYVVKIIDDKGIVYTAKFVK